MKVPQHALAHVGAGLVAVVAMVLWWGVCRRNPLEIGADEGMQMSKAVLLAEAPHLAHRAWNDQPWAYPVVLARLRGLDGEWVWGRMFTAGLAAMWMVALPRLMPPGAGAWHGFFGAALLLTWPRFFELGCSMMPEVPAMSLALLALVPLARPVRRETAVWALSGLLAGAACAIKLSALLTLAGAGVLMAWRLRETNPNSPPSPGPSVWARWRWVALPVIWALAGLGCWLLLSSLGPPTSWDLLVRSHVQAGAALRSGIASEDVFRPAELLQAAAAFLASAAAVVMLHRRHALRRAVLPLVLVLVPLVVHSVHRPYWFFYTTHFATGSCVLGGWGVGELVAGTLRRLRSATAGDTPVSYESRLLAATLVLSVWVTLDLPRTWSAARATRWRERAADNRLVSNLRALKPNIRQGYSVVNAVMAQAGIVMVPELTILPKKRFWTGAMTDSQVVAIVKREQPEVLVLVRGREDKQPLWQALLKERYVLLDSENGLDLYAARTLGVAKPEGNLDFLRRLGL